MEDWGRKLEFCNQEKKPRNLDRKRREKNKSKRCGPDVCWENPLELVTRQVPNLNFHNLAEKISFDKDWQKNKLICWLEIDELVHKAISIWQTIEVCDKNLPGCLGISPEPGKKEIVSCERVDCKYIWSWSGLLE